MMEKLLNEQDTATIRKFIETELAKPSYKVGLLIIFPNLTCPLYNKLPLQEVKLLHRALNQLWEDVMCNLTQFHFEQEALVFLCEREKVRLYHAFMHSSLMFL